METIEPNMHTVATIVANDDGRPIAMVNLLKFHDLARYPEASREAAEQVTGRDAYRRYAEAFGALIEGYGAHTLYWGDSSAYFIGDGDWDAVWINRFPNLQALTGASTDPRYAEMARHRKAGLAHQHAIVTRPLV